jgi:hypothetical protein
MPKPNDEFSLREIERQDDVDGLIYDLIVNLCPEGPVPDWNIEHISEVREAIQDIIVDKLKLMTEQQFYPYREIPVTENPDYKPEQEPEEIIVTDEQLVTALNKAMEELDAEDLCVVAGDALGGLCWYLNDGTYSFIPTECYCGALDFTKESNGN